MRKFLATALILPALVLVGCNKQCNTKTKPATCCECKCVDPDCCCNTHDGCCDTDVPRCPQVNK